MPLVLANRVQETSTTTGTGTLTLDGAVLGYQTFAAGIGSGNTCYYAITSGTGAWEVGIGTVGTGTLARTTLLSSSTGSLVSFTGTLNVYVTYPSEKSVNLDASNVMTGYPITVADNVFTLQDNVDPTKQAQFQLSGLATGTTITYTLPATATTLAGLAISNTFTSTNIFSSLNNSFGTYAGAATSTTGLSIGAQTGTKTVNIGTGGLSGSTTNITVGATAGTSTTTMNGQVDLGGTTTSVNFARITGAATGAAPTISAQGSDAHINLNLTTKGVNGAVNLQPNGALTLVVGQSGTGVGNNIAIYPTTNTMNWVLRGPDTNIGYTLQTKGTGNFYYVTGGGQQAVIADTQSAVNYLGITGSITSEAPSIYVAGSDANINLNLTPKGTGSVTINATTAITVPAGTTAQRPTGATGMFRYNSTTAGFEGYNGTVWGAIGGGSNITTLGLWENASVIAANYTIGTGNNATSAGPITINSGVVVTVPSGSTWVVV